MASIKKRGAYQWQARVRRRGWPVQIKTFDSKGDAEAWARQAESEMDRGVFISRVEAENTTLAEALERFEQEYIPRYKHAKRESQRVQKILQHKITSRFLATIRAKDINDYIRERSQIVGANTIRLELALLKDTKNRTARSVPLSPAALRVLQEAAGGSKVTAIAGSVFNESSDRVTHNSAKACKKAGIQDLRFHDLRHEAISRFFENTDLDVMEIKSITGHKSMQMLARYSHLRTHRLADRLAGKARGQK